MSRVLFKKMMLKKYPEIANVPNFNVTRFARGLSDFIKSEKQKLKIFRVEGVRDLILHVKSKFGPNTLCELEEIDLLREEKVLAGQNQDDENGVLEEEIGERDVTSANLIRIARALKNDIERLFPLITPTEERIFQATMLLGLLNLSKSKLKKWS
ncbi:uncharacterized protein LOC135842388 isoform X1 [Planococcus citri]|uniref:uncharacterized protein LOC135842388 isoform X1 n=1 Tax=Planococcus citri TaxID=170843 RepID=UPI0031F9A0D2